MTHLLPFVSFGAWVWLAAAIATGHLTRTDESVPGSIAGLCTGVSFSAFAIVFGFQLEPPAVGELVTLAGLIAFIVLPVVLVAVLYRAHRGRGPALAQ